MLMHFKMPELLLNPRKLTAASRHAVLRPGPVVTGPLHISFEPKLANTYCHKYNICSHFKRQIPFSSRQVRTRDIINTGLAVLVVLITVFIHQDVIATEFDVVPYIISRQLFHYVDVLTRARRHTNTDPPRLARPSWIQKEHFTAHTKILTF